MTEMVPLRREAAGQYVTLDGRYRIERQDGMTECDHPLCYDLHRRFHEATGKHGEGGWIHWTTYVAWHIWDTKIDDYADRNGPGEYETKRDAHQALTDILAEQAS